MQAGEGPEFGSAEDGVRAEPEGLRVEVRLQVPVLLRASAQLAVPARSGRSLRAVALLYQRERGPVEHLHLDEVVQAPQRVEQPVVRLQTLHLLEN